jgi:hypothetical protein
MKSLVLFIGMIAAAGSAFAADLQAQGKALLIKFLDPAADRAALTRQLKATDVDIRAVYAEPLASKLIAGYAQMHQAGAAIGPKPGQTELLYVYATTGQLKTGAPVAGEFPGGYAQVKQYILKDVPIVRFKFVSPGETTGMAYDGLVHVNGRWVFMPKPWRGLE